MAFNIFSVKICIHIYITFRICIHLKKGALLKRTNGSVAGKLACKKHDIIIAQTPSKLRKCIDVVKIDFLRGYSSSS